jgi:L-fuconolactonase
MKIDSHQHFWKYNPTRDSWITDQMSILKRDFFPEDLAQTLQANGIDATIAVQANQSEAETLFLLQLADKYPSIAGVVGWMDLRSPRAVERMQFFSQFEKLRGFRHIAQSEPDDGFLVRKDFLCGIGCLRQFGFAYDILIYPRQLPAALELVARFPEQAFVIDHLAKPDIRAGRTDNWAPFIRKIAQNLHVYCKLSGMVTEDDWHHWRKEDFRPYLDVVFEAFGADRLMFGSDWPVCLLAARYEQVLDIVLKYVERFPADVKEKIFGGNAAQFYRLKTARHGSAA